MVFLITLQITTTIAILYDLTMYLFILQVLTLATPAWFFTFLASLPAFFLITYSDSRHRCILMYLEDVDGWQQYTSATFYHIYGPKIYFTLYITLHVLLPLMVMLICCCLAIGYTTRNIHKTTENTQISTLGITYGPDSGILTKILLAVTAFFGLCKIPGGIIQILTVFGTDPYTTFTGLEQVLLILMEADIAVHPLIFFLFQIKLIKSTIKAHSTNSKNKEKGNTKENEWNELMMSNMESWRARPMPNVQTDLVTHSPQLAIRPTDGSLVSVHPQMMHSTNTDIMVANINAEETSGLYAISNPVDQHCGLNEDVSCSSFGPVMPLTPQSSKRRKY